MMEHVPVGTGLAADEGSWLLSWKGLAGILILSWNQSGQPGTYLGYWCCGLPLRLSAFMLATAQALGEFRQPRPHGLKLDRVMMIASGGRQHTNSPITPQGSSQAAGTCRAPLTIKQCNHSVPTGSTRYCRQNVSIDQTAHRA